MQNSSRRNNSLPQSGDVVTQFHIGTFEAFVCSDFYQVKDHWDALQHRGPATIYQSFHWQVAWLETIGQAMGAKPLVTVLTKNTTPVFLLPMIMTRKSGLVTAQFAGGDHANYKFALFDPNVADELVALLPQLLIELAKVSSPEIDAFDFTRVPLKWDESDNPLARAFPSKPSPENGGSVSLNGGFEAVLSNGNAKRKRKIMRAQERALEALDGSQLKTNLDRQAATVAYSAFVEQKKQWFSERGIINPFEDDATTAFFAKLSEQTHQTDDCLLDFTVLQSNDDHLAILAHGSFKDQVFGYFTSMNLDEKYKTLSPGAYVFHKKIEECCESGMRRFDFGVGGERYKTSWCDEHHDLVDITIPVTTKGRLYYGIVRLKRQAKQQIKENDAVWSFVKKWRKNLLGSTK